MARRRVTLSLGGSGGGGGSGTQDYPTRAEMEAAGLRPSQRIALLRDIAAENSRIRAADRAARGIPENYTPQNERSWSAAQSLVSLLTSEDADAEKQARDWLDENRETITPEDAAAIGFVDGSNLGDVLSNYDRQKGDKPSIWERAAGTVGSALGVIARPGQAGVELAQAVQNVIPRGAVGGPLSFINPGTAAARVLDDRTQAEREADGGFGDVWRALAGQDRLNPQTGRQDDYIPLFTALGHDRPGGWSGRGYDLAQFTAESALDPLTYVSGGTKAGARPFLDAAGTTLAREAAEGGVRSASPLLSRRLAREGAEMGEDVIRRQLAETGVRGLSREGRQAVQRELAQTVGERAARRSYQAARRFDRGGLRIGIGGPRGFGRSLVPGTAGRALGRVPIGGSRNLLLDTVRFTPNAEMERRALTDAEALAQELIDKADLRRADLGDTPAEDVLRDLTAYSYRLDDSAARSARRGAADADLVGFDAERLRTALAGQDPADILEAIGNPAGRRRPGAPDLEARVRAWQEIVRDIAPTEARAAAIRNAAASGDLAALRSIAPEVGTAGVRNRDILRRGLASDLRRTRGVSALENALSTRARVRRSQFFDGQDVSRRLHDIQTQAHASGFQEGQRRWRSLFAGSRSVDDPTRRGITELLDVPRASGDAAPVLDDVGTDAAGLLGREQSRLYNTLVNDVGIPPENLREVDDYFPHLLTDKGRQWLAKNFAEIPPDVVQDLGLVVDRGRVGFRDVTDNLGASAQGGHLKRRGSSLSVTEKNEKLVTALEDAGVRIPDEFYELDPFKAMARRGNEVDRSLVLAKTFDDASRELLAPDGGQLVMRARPDASDVEKDAVRFAAEKRGLKEIESADGSLLFAHPDLARDMERYISVLSDDEALEGLRRFTARWQTLWRGYATVPLTGGLGFAHRNTLGNIANMYVAGMNNPLYFGRALKIQNEVRAAISANPEMPIVDALKANGAGERTVDVVSQALERGVFRDGFSIADLPTSQLNALDFARNTKGGVRKGLRSVNPVDQDNILLRSGGWYNAGIENNARLAMFMHTLDNTGNPAVAAERTREVLFDYRDLTEFEKKAKTTLIPFWTFTRRNLPLQIRNLANNPGRVARFERGMRALISGPGEDQTGDDTWAGQSGTAIGGVKIPNWAATRGNLAGPGFFGTADPTFARADTPFVASLETADPALRLAQLLSGRGTNDLGEPVSGADFARSVISQVGGGPVEVAKIGAEEATGKSLFTGGNIVDRETGERNKNVWLRLSQAISPAVDKTYRVWGGGTDDPTSQLLWEALTGVNATRVTAENDETTRSRAIEELRDALTLYNRAHPDNPAPDLNELKRAGIVPDPVRDAREAEAGRGGSGGGGGPTFTIRRRGG